MRSPDLFPAKEVMTPLYGRLLTRFRIPLDGVRPYDLFRLKPLGYVHDL
jgi:hypothetical protein